MDPVEEGNSSTIEPSDYTPLRQVLNEENETRILNEGFSDFLLPHHSSQPSNSVESNDKCEDEPETIELPLIQSRKYAKHVFLYVGLRRMGALFYVSDKWVKFAEGAKNVETLRRIELKSCPVSAPEQFVMHRMSLEMMYADNIRAESLNRCYLSPLTNLTILDVKSISLYIPFPDIEPLKELTNLKHLTLKHIRNLAGMSLHAIAQLTVLESLELSECSDFPAYFGEDTLRQLTNLKKLRLEINHHVIGNFCHGVKILDTVKELPSLEHLELIDFDFDDDLSEALGKCTNIKKLLVIPKYVNRLRVLCFQYQHGLLRNVLKLRNNLTHFVWGITLDSLGQSMLCKRLFKDLLWLYVEEQETGESIMLFPHPTIKLVNISFNGTRPKSIEEALSDAFYLFVSLS